MPNPSWPEAENGEVIGLLVLSAYRMPDGDATAHRLLQLARSACPSGTTALIVNDWPWDGTRPPHGIKPLPGVRLVHMHTKGSTLLTRAFLRFTRPFRALRVVRRHVADARSIAAVCVPLGLLSLSLCTVLRVALRRPLVVDACERHDSTQFRLGPVAPYLLRHRWTSVLARHGADRTVVVSTRLGAYFARPHNPVIVVPPQVDCDDFGPPDPPPLRAGLRLLYAGTPGAKDLLDVIVEALARLRPDDRARIELLIAGPPSTDAHRYGRRTGGSGDAARVTFVGRVSRAEVRRLLSRSHFSVLVRPCGGYADAGFPSKIPESLAAGCPVILNHTSDLAIYVADGREGLVLGGSSIEDVCAGLRRALSLDEAAWRGMSDAARARAMASFDYRVWRPTVADFVLGGRTGEGTLPPPGATAVRTG